VCSSDLCLGCAGSLPNVRVFARRPHARRQLDTHTTHEQRLGSSLTNSRGVQTKMKSLLSWDHRVGVPRYNIDVRAADAQPCAYAYALNHGLHREAAANGNGMAATTSRTVSVS